MRLAASGRPTIDISVAHEITHQPHAIALSVSDMHLVEIAADHSAKIGTVRAYSKIVFRKTGTQGQAELAALLTRLAFLVPLRRGEEP